MKNDEVRAAIDEGIKNMQRETKVSVEDHLEKLKEIRDKALEAGNLGAAARAEELRGKVSGHYVEGHKDVSDEMTDEQIIIQVRNDVDADTAIKMAKSLGLPADKLREIFGEDAVGLKAA